MGHFRGLTVTRLAANLGTSPQTLRRFAADTARHYRQVDVTLGSKNRTLTIPSDPLKALQRDLLRDLFYSLPRPAFLGHTKGKGVVWALKRHQGDQCLLHVDLKNFFPSVSPERVEAALSALKVRRAASQLLSRLVTWRDELPQGAPTSVAVGDLVLYRLDQRLQGLAKAHGMTYTRYVDDITISGQVAIVERFAPEITKYIEADGWELSRKGGLYGPDECHEMLNAVVNRKPNVSKSYYGSVRNPLRGIARFGHRPTTEELDSLAAKVVWIATVNPDRHPALLRLLREAVEAMGDGGAGEAATGQTT